MPNFYGPQRFGRDGETLKLGMSLVRREQPPAHVVRQRAESASEILSCIACLSAAQAAFVPARISPAALSDGLLRRVLVGDVMAKWPFGGMFVAADVVREQERFDARETVTAGPIFGRKTFPAAEEAAAREAAVLEEAGLTALSFAGFGKLVQGTRRHNLVAVAVSRRGGGTRGRAADFPRRAGGSYATPVLLRD